MPSSLGRVLVVEDEPRVAAMLREVLVELGYIVKVAVGGAEALQLVPVFEPDVVLLDLLMPEMSGVEVLDHLRRDRPTLPVVIMSGERGRRGGARHAAGRGVRLSGQAVQDRRARAGRRGGGRATAELTQRLHRKAALVAPPPGGCGKTVGCVRPLAGG